MNCMPRFLALRKFTISAMLKNAAYTIYNIFTNFAEYFFSLITEFVNLIVIYSNVVQCMYINFQMFGLCRVIFGMIVSLPILVAYYAILEFVHWFIEIPFLKLKGDNRKFLFQIDQLKNPVIQMHRGYMQVLEFIMIVIYVR